LASDPWELDNVADDPAYAKQVRELAVVLEEWIEQSDDFPAAYRVRDDNTDRITGVPFRTKIPPLRHPGCRRLVSAGDARDRASAVSAPPAPPQPSGDGWLCLCGRLQPP
jgi:hypothetical protein